MVVSFLSLFIRYCLKNWIYTFLGAILFLFIILRAYCNIDIGIPCLWHNLFGFECPGCGLTRAAANVMKFEFGEAFRMNKLVYIVIPGLLYYIIKDFIRFIVSEIRA